MLEFQIQDSNPKNRNSPKILNPTFFVWFAYLAVEEFAGVYG